MKMLRVTSKKDGFRRAGRAWSGTTQVAVAELGKGQLDQLQSEPMLVVQEFEAADPGQAKAPDDGKGAKGSAAGKADGKTAAQ